MPRFTTCFGPRTACAGLMARIWPTMSQFEQHADRDQVLLDGRPRRSTLFHCRIAGVRHFQRLDIGRDMERLDIDEPADAVLFEPGEERADGPRSMMAGAAPPWSKAQRVPGGSFDRRYQPTWLELIKLRKAIRRSVANASASSLVSGRKVWHQSGGSPASWTRCTKRLGGRSDSRGD